MFTGMFTVSMSSAVLIGQAFLSGRVEVWSFPLGLVLAAALMVTLLLLVSMADRQQRTPARMRLHRRIEAYQRFLTRHDGARDLRCHTLSAREGTLVPFTGASEMVGCGLFRMLRDCEVPRELRVPRSRVTCRLMMLFCGAGGCVDAIDYPSNCGVVVGFRLGRARAG